MVGPCGLEPQTVARRLRRKMAEGFTAQDKQHYLSESDSH